MIPSATATPVHQLAAVRPAADGGTLAAMPPCTLGIGMTPASGAPGGVFVRLGVGSGLIGDGTSGPEPMNGSWRGPGAATGACAGGAAMRRGAGAGDGAWATGGADMCLAIGGALGGGGNGLGALMPGGTTKPLTCSTARLYGCATTTLSTVAFRGPAGAAEETVARPSAPE